jgi:hypothetical protein
VFIRFLITQNSVEVRATQIETALRAHEFAMVVLQQPRAVRTDLRNVHRASGRLAPGTGRLARLLAGRGSALHHPAFQLSRKNYEPAQKYYAIRFGNLEVTTWLIRRCMYLGARSLRKNHDRPLQLDLYNARRGYRFGALLNGGRFASLLKVRSLRRRIC